jgi:ADP-dependent NAD(P)H-hydrate dehydratase
VALTQLKLTDLPLIPTRKSDAHKGSFGTVLVIGGSASNARAMLGAPCFAAMGALRSGCGLCHLAVPDRLVAHALEVVPSAMAISLPTDEDGSLVAGFSAGEAEEAITDADCTVLGPGLGFGQEEADIVEHAINATREDQIPLVIDADGLNNLATRLSPKMKLHNRVVLTPHPGEFKRLLKAALRDTEIETQPQRIAACASLAGHLGCVVVLKGAGTVVSNGSHIFVNDTGSPALATAGTGDVLAGVIGGLITQYLQAGDLTDLTLMAAASRAVAAHGTAGTLWSQKTGAQAGLLARELADHIPAALEGHRSRG